MTTATIAPINRSQATPVAVLRRPTVAELTHLGEAIAAHGIAAHEGDVQHLVATLRHLGVTSAALGVLADETAPEVVRTRAFLVVASRLLASRSVRPEGQLVSTGSAGSPNATAKASTQAA